MMEHIRGRGGCRIGFIILTILILTLYVVTFTGCTSKFAATPVFYLLTIRKSGNWLRLNYFGACFGDASGLIACAGTIGSPDAIVASMKLDAGKAGAAAFLVKYAQKIQSSALVPYIPLGAGLFYVISSLVFVIRKDSSYLWQPGHLSNIFTFKMAFASISLLAISMVQISTAVVGMAAANEMMESAEFKIEKNIIVVMALQGIAICLHSGFAFLMWSRCKKVEQVMSRGHSSHRSGGTRSQRPRDPTMKSSQRPR